MRTGVAALVLVVLFPVRSFAADPYPVDVLLPLTGSAAFAGEAQQQVLRLYENRINKTGGIHGRPLHFDFHDDQSNPVVAVQIVNELLPKKPAVILGPSVASTCSAISPLLAKGPTVNYCFSPVTPPPPGSFVFAATEPATSLLKNDVDHLRSLGFHRAALLVSTDASGQKNAEIFESLLGKGPSASLALIAEERFSPTAIGIAAQLAKVKAMDPDVILLWANGTSFLMALRELKNAGLEGLPVTTNPFNGDGALLRKNADIVPSNLFIQGLPYQGKNPPAALRDTGNEYISVFRDAGLSPASVIQAYCWDPTKITIAALRALPLGASGEQLHAYLERLHDFPGLFGMYDFRGGDNYGLNGADDPFVRWDAARSDWVPF